MKTKLTLLLLTVISINNLFAQDTLRVLFLGNSYTSFNNLPQLVQSLSGSAGKTLIIDSNMPGGMTVSGHVNNATSIAKISQGNWDYVVIQEQSQIPSINYYRYNYLKKTKCKITIFLRILLLSKIIHLSKNTKTFLIQRLIIIESIF